MLNTDSYKVDDSATFLTQGEELIDTFGMVTERKPSWKEYFFVKNFVLGKAVELLLKSFLLSTADYNSVKEVNSKFGNDLLKLGQEVSLYKNSAIVPVYKVLQNGDLKNIEEINKTYSKKEAEDVKFGEKNTVELGILFDTATSIKNNVKEAIESGKRFSK